MKKDDILVYIYIGCLAIAELMGAKTFPIISIFGYQLNASTAIFVMPLLFTINDVVTEVYGPERTRSIVRSGLIVIALFSIFALFFTTLPPSKRFLALESAYDTIFTQSARISISSIIAFALSEFSDIFIFVKIRKALGKKSLWLRNNVSNFIAQFLDTTVFMTLAFYALNKPISSNIEFLTSLILPYWILKCCMSILETPLVYLGVNWLNENKQVIKK
jgi:queuosine precursor transporter